MRAEALRVAVLDVGKTNVKLVLADGTGAVIGRRERPGATLPGPPYPHLDVDGIWAFAMDGLAEFAGGPGVSHVTATGHGGGCALIGEDGLVLPVMDYEDGGDAAGRAAYDAQRAAFEETGSPPLGGLNLGWQLHRLEAAQPEAFARARRLLLWPQYWTWRLSGVAASEITYLACHTDLWAPWDAAPSSMAVRRGWDALIPPRRDAWASLGSPSAEVRERTGLSAGTKVLTGMHDSNAALLPHLDGEGPCAVISTGTWVVVMAVRQGAPRPGAEAVLVNVNAYGEPVPTAIFMGGRHRADLLGADAEGETDPEAMPDAPDAELIDGSGPAPEWRPAAAALSPAGRRAAVARHLALVSAERLADIAATEGDVRVEGPLAHDAVYLDVLARGTGRRVVPVTEGTGPVAGAVRLAMLHEAGGAR